MFCCSVCCTIISHTSLAYFFQCLSLCLIVWMHLSALVFEYFFKLKTCYQLQYKSGNYLVRCRMKNHGNNSGPQFSWMWLVTIFLINYLPKKKKFNETTSILYLIFMTWASEPYIMCQVHKSSISYNVHGKIPKLVFVFPHFRHLQCQWSLAAFERLRVSLQSV